MPTTDDEIIIIFSMSVRPSSILANLSLSLGYTAKQTQNRQKSVKISHLKSISFLSVS